MRWPATMRTASSRRKPWRSSWPRTTSGSTPTSSRTTSSSDASSCCSAIPAASGTTRLRSQPATPRSSCAPARSGRSPPAASRRRSGPSARRSGSRARSTASASSCCARSQSCRTSASWPCSRRRRRTGAAARSRQAVSEFLDARVAQGERLTTAELEKLDIGLQPLVAELFDGATPATRTSLSATLEQWRQQSIDTGFFRELGRLIKVDDHPQATLVGSRAAAVDTVASALSPRSPRSVLLVGEQGVGKTTLVVEALRRLEQPVVRVPGCRDRGDGRPGLHR